MTKLQGVQVRQILQREASMEISNIAIAIRHQIGSDGACLGEKLAERSGMLFFD